MKVLTASIAFLAAVIAGAETPAVDERELRDSGQPIPFLRVFNLPGPFIAASWIEGATGSQFRTAEYNSYQPEDWSISGRLELPAGSKLINVHGYSTAERATFVVPVGTGHELRCYFGPTYWNWQSVPVTRGKLRNALSSLDGHVSICWLVDSPSGDFVQIFRQTDLPNTPRVTPIEKSKKLLNYHVDKVGTAFVSTVAYNGTVNHRQLFSTGRVRWHRSFPAETQVVVDTDGYTFTLRSTPEGITVARYDYNGNIDGSTLLPSSLGRRIDTFTLESNRYLMVVASKPITTGRSASVVRISPTMEVRALPLEGSLESGSLPRIAADSAQTYICSVTATLPREEIVQAVDTRYMVSRWTVRRPFGADEDQSQLYASPYGLITTNNRNGLGVSRKYIDYGFLGFYPQVIHAKGGTSKSLTFNWYVGRPEEHTVYFTSSDPVNCKVQDSIRFSGFRTFSVTAELAPVTQRTQYRVDAYDPWSHTSRPVIIIVDP